MKLRDDTLVVLAFITSPLWIGAIVIAILLLFGIDPSRGL